jgi:hypothetical protein
MLGDDLNRMQESILGLTAGEIDKEVRSALTSYFGESEVGAKTGPAAGNLRKSQNKSWRSVRQSRVFSHRGAPVGFDCVCAHRLFFFLLSSSSSGYRALWFANVHVIGVVPGDV